MKKEEKNTKKKLKKKIKRKKLEIWSKQKEEEKRTKNNKKAWDLGKTISKLKCIFKHKDEKRQKKWKTKIKRKKDARGGQKNIKEI